MQGLVAVGKTSGIFKPASGLVAGFKLSASGSDARLHVSCGLNYSGFFNAPIKGIEFIFSFRQGSLKANASTTSTTIYRNPTPLPHGCPFYRDSLKTDSFTKFFELKCSIIMETMLTLLVVSNT